MTSSKLTEDEVVKHLAKWLTVNGWQIITETKGHKHGLDIEATKDNKTLIVESKGSKGSKSSHITTREKFDCGQIKTHFGKAIVKVLEERHKNPDTIIAIAHPDDKDIKTCLRNVIPEVLKSNIVLFWVSPAGVVQEQL